MSTCQFLTELRIQDKLSGMSELSEIDGFSDNTRCHTISNYKKYCRALESEGRTESERCRSFQDLSRGFAAPVIPQFNQSISRDFQLSLAAIGMDCHCSQDYSVNNTIRTKCRCHDVFTFNSLTFSQILSDWFDSEMQTNQAENEALQVLSFHLMASEERKLTSLCDSKELCQNNYRGKM